MASKSDEIVVMQPDEKVRVKLLVGLSIALIVVIIASVAAYLLLFNGKGQESKQGVPKGQALDQAINRAYAQKDYDKAASLVAQQGNANDPAMQLKLALAYSNGKQYSKALEIFASLDKAGKLNSSYLSAAAETAVSAGNKQSAIHYYQEAVAKVKSEGAVTADSQTEVYQKKIDDLSQ